MTARLAAVVASVALLAGPAHAAAALPPGRYEVDAGRSSVRFRVRQLGLMAVEGRFKSFSGTVKLAEPFERSRVEGVVEAGSIDTGIRKRDEHLRSAAFFEAAAFPAMSFKSTRVAGTPEAFEMDGELTLKGVTRPVRFHCARTGDPAAPGLAVTARAVINRRDFGMTYNPVIGGTIVITLEIAAECVQ